MAEKRESGENDIETLTKEIKEELSVDIVKDSINYYGTFKAQTHGKVEGMLVKMTCYIAEFNGQLKANSKIAEIMWLNYVDIVFISPVDKLIFKVSHSKGLLI